MGKWFLLALPFLALLIFTDSVLLKANFGRGAYLQPCARWDDPELHHYYAHGCQSQMLVGGETVSYTFNEDGFRDRPRAFFAGGSIQVFGDSVIKGIYLNDDETIPRELERRIGGKLGFPFLNAGLRLSSPILQSQIYRRNGELYPAKAWIVFLDGHTPIFERFFRSQAETFDEFGVPTRFKLLSGMNPWSGGLLSRLRHILPTGLITIGASKLEHAETWKREIEAVPPSKENLCAGIQRFARDAKSRKIPLLFVLLPHWVNTIAKTQLAQVEFKPEFLETLGTCAKETGSTFVNLFPLRDQLLGEYFSIDSMHYSRAGVRWIAGHLEKPLFEALTRQLKGAAKR